jgi:radical SAM protein with 4Fe4S-binding SPASM domain
MYNLDDLLGSRETCRSVQRQVVDGEPALYLRSVKLKIISACNLMCEMCKYWQMARVELPRDVILNTLDHAAQLGCLKVHLSGGEVTLHRDLTAAIERGAQLGMRMNLTSNGVLMDKSRARAWVNAGLRAASFSLDGARAKTHDGIRGVPGVYKRTIRAIRILRREVDRLDARLRIRVNNVLSSRNLDELPALIEIAGELGVVDVVPMPIDGAKVPRPSVEQIERFNAEIAPRMLELRRKYNMPIDAGRLYPFGRTSHDVALSARGEYALGHYDHSLCYAPYFHAFISHNGDVFACCMTRDRMKPLGNVQRQSLTEIFLGAEYQRFRDAMRETRLKICRNCDQYLRENRLVDSRLVQLEATPPPPRLSPATQPVGSSLAATFGEPLVTLIAPPTF